jgi:hypothetical protein
MFIKNVIWRFADVAQLVEHSTRNTAVIGSNPIVGSFLGKALAAGQSLFVRHLTVWYFCLKGNGGR